MITKIYPNEKRLFVFENSHLVFDTLNVVTTHIFIPPTPRHTLTYVIIIIRHTSSPPPPTTPSHLRKGSLRPQCYYYTKLLMYTHTHMRVHAHPCTHDDGTELNVLGCRVDILGTNCDQCVCMVQCCFTSTETIRLIRTESPGRPSRLSHSS